MTCAARATLDERTTRVSTPKIALGILIVALGLEGCKRPSSVRETRERPLELLVSTDAETLDPRYATDAVGMRVSRLVHAGLVRLDATTLEPRPYLARAWHWQDARTLVVELRGDVRFHSGAALTSRDVVATIAALKSADVASRHARVVEPIGEVRAEDDHHVVFTLKRAHATLLTDLELPILRADEASGPPRPDGQLDGLGPYVVQSAAPGSVELTPAEASTLPKPAHAVTIRTVHDENARALRMHAGRGDVVVNGFSPTLLPALAEAKGISVSSRAGANLTYMIARTDRGALADERVRKALSLAVDRTRIASTLLAGHATAASTLLPPTHWAFSEAPPLPYAPERAAALLDEARVRPLRLTLLTSTDRLRGTIARQMAQDFASAGIELEIIPLELGTMIARLGAGDFELATLQLPELTEPNVLRVFLHSSSVPPNGANRGRVRDPDVDALLEHGDEENDLAARRAIYASLERVIRDRALLLPLWHEDQVAVTSKRANAFRPSAEGRWLDLAAVAHRDE